MVWKYSIQSSFLSSQVNSYVPHFLWAFLQSYSDKHFIEKQLCNLHYERPKTLSTPTATNLPGLCKKLKSFRKVIPHIYAKEFSYSYILGSAREIFKKLFTQVSPRTNLIKKSEDEEPEIH